MARGDDREPAKPASPDPGLLEAAADLRFSGGARVCAMRLRLHDIRQMGPGSLVALDRLVGDPLELVVGGVVLARGDLLSQGGQLMLRVTSVGDDDGRD